MYSYVLSKYLHVLRYIYLMLSVGLAVFHGIVSYMHLDRSVGRLPLTLDK